uniref:Uncharacterized protein n=1 Tax=Geospiza parvula TaxID=87175 RepID=A0A8C3NLU3_GEOPR
MEGSVDTEEPPLLPLALSSFHISEEFGFLLPDPLTELPAPYSPWMDIARELPQLITNHQLRSRVHQMPQLSPQQLRGREELHLAHLVLSFITMGYVWQEGEEGTVQLLPPSCSLTTSPPSPVLCDTQVLPRNLAVPFWEVSQALGLPPILSHADFVLANWRRKDPNGNLDPIIALPGGESLRGFILVTLLVEKAAVPGIKQLVPVHAAAHDTPCCSYYVDPEVFYSVIRIFLSGWKDNPAMAHGLIYEGVSPEALAFSGGSAAQSTVLHAFDELLGICHRQDSAFLHRMREYMPPAHRTFVEQIRGAVSPRHLMLSSGNPRLRAAFNRCVSALAELRSYHITIVTKYIAVAAAKAKARRAELSEAGPAVRKAPSALEDKGTGGSHIFSFLKSIRDTTREGMIRA